MAEKTIEIIRTSEGLRTVLRLLASLPPELTVQELKERVVEETLLADYHQLDGRRHTHWRDRTYNLLMFAPDISEELIRKGTEKIINGLKGNLLTEWMADLWFVPHLPKDLKDSFLESNHQNCLFNAEVKKALTDILPCWLAASIRGGQLFIDRESVPLFSNWGEWQLGDRDESGALLFHRAYRTALIEAGDTKVALLPDVTGQGQGCALEVAPLISIRTIREAIAWIYQQDPEKWQGFDTEV